ncbi:MAG: MOSC domain-containing protein [Oscillospiraceae bacterium]|nr:MOSC domain-containing protein [Oscillospiraceae bacterium]
MGKIAAVCISEKKGTVKKDIGRCLVIKGFGLAGDAHAGSERQVSLLPAESVRRFGELTQGKVELPAGVFGENLLTEGLDLESLCVGDRIRAGEALMEITQKGKTCHTNCEIRNIAGDCIMPREGVFAMVLEGGYVSAGDEIAPVPERPLSVSILTVSDRAFFGGYEDKSGQLIADICVENGFHIMDRAICCDDEDKVRESLIRLCDASPDILFTSGGTGFSLRDRVPEATMSVCERNAPGIAEAIRAYSMKITPRAMLSRGTSVIRRRTVIVNLPGSPKAVEECLDVIFPTVFHGIKLLRGEADK